MLTYNELTTNSKYDTFNNSDNSPDHWHFRDIERDKIRKIYVRKYKPIWEYLGWGIRFGPSGRAYNTMGKIGLQLELKNGRKILIGTQKKEELKEIIQKLKEEKGWT